MCVYSSPMEGNIRPRPGSSTRCFVNGVSNASGVDLEYAGAQLGEYLK
jgi:hypothetical protein